MGVKYNNEVVKMTSEIFPCKYFNKIIIYNIFKHNYIR